MSATDWYQLKLALYRAKTKGLLSDDRDTNQLGEAVGLYHEMRLSFRVS